MKPLFEWNLVFAFCKDQRKLQGDSKLCGKKRKGKICTIAKKNHMEI